MKTVRQKKILNTSHYKTKTTINKNLKYVHSTLPATG